MRKTPDEIKKGLECCKVRQKNGGWINCDSECPYLGEQIFCKNVLNYDALAYIQQLEAECHRLERERDALLKG